MKGKIVIHPNVAQGIQKPYRFCRKFRSWGRISPGLGFFEFCTQFSLTAELSFWDAHIDFLCSFMLHSSRWEFSLSWTFLPLEGFCRTHLLVSYFITAGHHCEQYQKSCFAHSGLVTIEPTWPLLSLLCRVVWNPQGLLPVPVGSLPTASGVRQHFLQPAQQRSWQPTLNGRRCCLGGQVDTSAASSKFGACWTSSHCCSSRHRHTRLTALVAGSCYSFLPFNRKACWEKVSRGHFGTRQVDYFGCGPVTFLHFHTNFNKEKYSLMQSFSKAEGHRKDIIA